ncbi:MAG: methylated-DNA--[protein]-cysteine S-methyltransferase [Alphaproteobacteria bacterium]|nr:methylated-DNA--[protein]-cysteine S-methyltransferase [Alphaproteobacteria bacterium]
MFYSFYSDSPVGQLLMTSDGQNLTGLQMNKQRYNHIAENCLQNNDLPIFLQTKQWLDDYCQGKKPSIAGLALKPQGSEFQQKVWRILQTIPYGEYITYGYIAKQVAQECGKAKMSAQAVGGAVGRNPICIIIPCHRVIGANGNLTGYDGGVDKKVILLRHEGFDMSQFTLPKTRA